MDSFLTILSHSAATMLGLVMILLAFKMLFYAVFGTWDRSKYRFDPGQQSTAHRLFAHYMERRNPPRARTRHLRIVKPDETSRPSSAGRKSL